MFEYGSKHKLKVNEFNLNYLSLVVFEFSGVDFESGNLNYCSVFFVLVLCVELVWNSQTKDGSDV